MWQPCFPDQKTKAKFAAFSLGSPANEGPVIHGVGAVRANGVPLGGPIGASFFLMRFWHLKVRQPKR
jgi:hypothetical protein